MTVTLDGYRLLCNVAYAKCLLCPSKVTLADYNNGGVIFSPTS